MKITITEGLSRIKMWNKRIIDTMAELQQHAPILTAAGLTAEQVNQKTNQIRDFQYNVARMRCAIAEVNQANYITVSGRRNTIAEWIVFKREHLSEELAMLRAVLAAQTRAEQQREQALQRMREAVGAEGKAELPELKFGLQPAQVREDILNLQKVEDELDERLSLANATLYVEMVE